MKKQYHLLKLTVVIGVLLSASVANANWFSNANGEKASSLPVAMTQQKTMTWLGVNLIPVSDEISQQIKDKLSKSKGVMIKGVQPGSPAESGNLKTFDVVLRFAGVHVNSPEQLNKLIYQTKANSKVKVEIVRQGKVQTINILLGSRQVSRALPAIKQPSNQNFQPQAMNKGFWDKGFMPGVGKNGLGNNLGSHFPDMPGMSMLGNNQNDLMFRQRKDGMIQIKGIAKDTKGARRNVFYQGRQQSIYDQILNQSNMPMSEKKRLLKALDNRLNKRGNWMGNFPGMNGSSMPFNFDKNNMFNPSGWWK